MPGSYSPLIGRDKFPFLPLVDTALERDPRQRLLGRLEVLVLLARQQYVLRAVIVWREQHALAADDTAPLVFRLAVALLSAMRFWNDFGQLADDLVRRQVPAVVPVEVASGQAFALGELELQRRAGRERFAFEDAGILDGGHAIGSHNFSAITGMLVVWQAMSPRAPVPKSTQPRQLNE